MRTPSNTRAAMGTRDAAEAAFKSATTKPPEQPALKPPAIPGAAELVSLRIARCAGVLPGGWAGVAGQFIAALRQAATK
jgi:hypothetical protein